MINRYKSLAALAGLITAAVLFTAQAGDETRSVYKFKTMDDSGELTVRLDSEELGFDPGSLADGESRTAVTGDGQTVTMTRNGDSMNLDVDGRQFDVPWGMHEAHHGDEGHRMIVHKMDAGHGDHIAVVTPERLDDATRETIRSALMSAGLDRKIVFVGGESDIDVEGLALDGLHSDTGAHPAQQIRIIRKHED